MNPCDYYPQYQYSADVEIQVQFFDLDPMEVVWHGNYVKYFEEARCALLNKLDYNYEQMKLSGYAWPVIDLHCRYIQSARFCQKINVRATIVEWENRMKINYLITDINTNQRLAKGSTVQVAVDMRTQTMCLASPTILLEKLEHYTK